MKIVLPGGTGHLGAMLARRFQERGDEVVVLSRGNSGVARTVSWDGKTLGDWAKEIDGSDVVINLAGRTVNCRYTKKNLDEMMSSRVDSTRVVGEAIAKASKPPRTWLQMSTATIYAHRLDAPNDELTGIIGGNEPDVPAYWGFSCEIAKNWERMQTEAATPSTRKVALRTSIVMSPDAGGAFSVLLRLARFGLGGAAAGGRQFMSWMHDKDFVRSVEWLIAHEDATGAFNLAAPGPLPQRDFMRVLRREWGMPIGLPAMKWMLEVGAFFLRTDTELVLKSRRVVPRRLLDAGFSFEFPTWESAARDLVARSR